MLLELCGGEWFPARCSSIGYSREYSKGTLRVLKGTAGGAKFRVDFIGMRGCSARALRGLLGVLS